MYKLQRVESSSKLRLDYREKPIKPRHCSTLRAMSTGNLITTTPVHKYSQTPPLNLTRLRCNNIGKSALRGDHQHGDSSIVRDKVERMCQRRCPQPNYVIIRVDKSNAGAEDSVIERCEILREHVTLEYKNRNYAFKYCQLRALKD